MEERPLGWAVRRPSVILVSVASVETRKVKGDCRESREKSGRKKVKTAGSTFQQFGREWQKRSWMIQGSWGRGLRI